MTPTTQAVLYLIRKKDIPKLITQLKKILTVYGPVAHRSQFRFDSIKDGSQLRLDYDTTILPPKKYFIPPNQEILSFKNRPQLEVYDRLAEEPDEKLWNGKEFLVFGVHPCDLAAISFHDAILTQLYPDPYRARRRKRGVIIGLYCLESCEDCFCKSARTMNWTECADLMFVEGNDSYYVQVLTQTGKQIIDYAKSLFQKASRKDNQIVENLLAKREQKFPDLIKDFAKLPQYLEASYEGEMWERYGKRCFGCGSCTMVCPTCFCFDVQDRVDLSLNGGVRIRNWDSCQLVDFALVAGGHNFRPTIPSRVRFRIYHKFRTEPEQIDKIGCVGCGRCTRTCPADIDMIELLTDIQKGGN